MTWRDLRSGSAALLARPSPHPARWIVASILLSALLTSPGSAQVEGSTAASPLTFRGFTAGDSLSRITASLVQLKGHRLGCTRSRADSTVQECRSTFTDGATGASVELWLSAIDGRAAILSLKADGTPAQLAAWRGELRNRYGGVETKLQGPQRMMQWVRRGRMIRLTWRMEGSGPSMSVSLVDGHILDDWGRRRQR